MEWKDEREEFMTLEELIREVPELEGYLRFMPEELKLRYTIKTTRRGRSFIRKMRCCLILGLFVRGIIG